MKIDDSIKLIKKLNYTISSKDDDVIITFKGTSHGSIPWHIRCGNYEAKGNSQNEIVSIITNELVNTIKKNIENSELQTKHLKNALIELGN